MFSDNPRPEFKTYSEFKTDSKPLLSFTHISFSDSRPGGNGSGPI